MIQVVTLSPAIDVTYELSEMRVGEVNRVQKVSRTPGGKGLNVARVLQKLGAAPILHCPLGGPSGQWIEGQLKAMGISSKVSHINGNTRSAVVVADAAVTVLNEPATEISNEEFEKVQHGIDESDVIVFSGSVPANVEAEQFESLLKTMKAKTKTLIVDTSGENLLIASRYAHYLKPNLEELENATGLPKAQAIESITSSGSKIILSLGERGVELYAENRHIAKVPIQQGNPTGAGDALTAGFAANFHRGERIALRHGSALSAASVNSDTAGDFEKLKYEQLLDEVQIT